MSTKTDKHPTLATIAEAIGVSRMTVSNAYNRPDQLSPALRDRILETAKQLGYGGPDPVARTLKRGATGSVGVVLDYALTTAFTDPATVQFLHGIAAGCEEAARGMSLVPRIEGLDAKLVGSALVDGFVAYCVPEDDPRWDAIRARNLPFTRVDFEPDPATRNVNVDDEGAARQVAEHLVALGHRRFGIVMTQDDPGPTAAAAQERRGRPSPSPGRPGAERPPPHGARRPSFDRTRSPKGVLPMNGQPTAILMAVASTRRNIHDAPPEPRRRRPRRATARALQAL